jgi:uncharacterized protein (DUF433 family)
MATLALASLDEEPNYSFVEAAQYLRLAPQETLRWVREGVVIGPSTGVSFNTLLELHILKGLRKDYKLPLQRIRKALNEYRRTETSIHPLLDPRLETDGIQMFLHDGDEYFNLNRARQMGMPEILSTYLRRIDRLPNGEMQFFPFVVRDVDDEPRTIQISPRISFGRPVLAGTGIATEVIAGRFRARDSIAELASEYEVSPTLIEDAIRWELPHLNAA